MIAKDKVVAFHYVLRNESGEEIENSHGDEPMVYLHGGYRNLLPKLEDALEGREPGDKFDVTLPPEHAYGLRLADAQQRVPIKHLLTRSKRYRPGMVVKVNTSDGPRDVIIVKVGKFNVDVDTNHPLAGITLTFDVEIIDIRAATDEEISHRHSHGWEPSAGHHH